MLKKTHKKTRFTAPQEQIAIIGMAGRFPGAPELDTFWKNIKNALESITFFSKAELLACGVDPALINHDDYVKARGIITGLDEFAADFFAYSPHEASMLDPQQRLFLECAWQALEQAGYTSTKFSGLIGVYAGMRASLYLRNNLLKNDEYTKAIDCFQLRVATSATTLSTRVSYQLNLHGPSVNISTACSSSLVAVSTACKSLLEGECDLALAGAVAIEVPQKHGYLYQADGIEAKDGHCRAFDAEATGTVFSDGMGIVVLKRLSAAIRDGDTIQAVIKGFAINNDGRRKVSFTAPSMAGQTECIVKALHCAQVHPDTIAYIEAHGTGTLLGDPIELAALKAAFETETHKKQFCAIGSVKTNIGHTDLAAGMAGLIKTVFALKEKYLPPSLHYKTPNPEIDFTDSPFFVNTKLTPWKTVNKKPRRASVSAFGVGGTNAHIILEEAPTAKKKSNANRPSQLLIFSAKTATALTTILTNLAQHVGLQSKASKQVNITDIAYTLALGRQEFAHKAALVCRANRQELINALNLLVNERPSKAIFATPKIAFIFPGQGIFYGKMASELYKTEITFNKIINECCAYLPKPIRLTIKSALANSQASALTQVIKKTAYLQVALFIIEYALAKYLMQLEIKPHAMIGHSLGEYTAACLAGVFSLPDAIKIISKRAQLISTTQAGQMVAVFLAENELKMLLTSHPKLSLAAVNMPGLAVVSGNAASLKHFCTLLDSNKIKYKKLAATYGFHSELMAPILHKFANFLKTISLTPPRFTYISNLTGTWVQPKEVSSPHYWVTHLRNTVQFNKGIITLLKDNINTFIEVGPGDTFSSLLRTYHADKNLTIINLLPGQNEKSQAADYFLKALAKLWLSEVKINWHNFYANEPGGRIPLPTYPFERKSYWVHPSLQRPLAVSGKPCAYDNWFYQPSWQRALPLLALNADKLIDAKKYCWIIFFDDQLLASPVIAKLKKMTTAVMAVQLAEEFLAQDTNYKINKQTKLDYEKIINLALIRKLPIRIIHLALAKREIVNETYCADFTAQHINDVLYNGFYSLLFTAQALLTETIQEPTSILVVTTGLHAVLSNDYVCPVKATVIGACRVIPAENELINIKNIDLDDSILAKEDELELLAQQLIFAAMNFTKQQNFCLTAYRQGYYWNQTFTKISLSKTEKSKRRSQGVYIITGGLGGIGLTLAKQLAQNCKPKLIFITRSPFLTSNKWSEWLTTHDTHEPISEIILQLQNLKAVGAEVAIYQGDVVDEIRIKAILDEVIKRFGAIHGVIHSAGVAGGGVAQFKTIAMAEKVFQPKVHGTYTLVRLVKDMELDFFILCSSVSAIVNELSQVDYCGANACLDAVATAKVFPASTLVTAINWPTWHTVGMAVKTARPTDISYLDRANTISPADGAKIFDDLLSCSHRQVIVSTYDIEQFIADVNASKDTILPKEQASIENPVAEQVASGHDVAPQNNVARQLEKIWADILGIEKISPQADFFALGGHSLMALRLISRIEKIIKQKINLQLLYKTRTIEKLVAHFSSLEQHKTPSALVLLQAGKMAPPLFLIHPIGGTVFCYLTLLPYLDKRYAIYGLQDPSIDDDKWHFSSIENMAAYYVEIIQATQPQGPYLIGGYSFGATVSIEIAKQLIAKKETISLLFLIDGWTPFSIQQQDPLLFKTVLREQYKGLPNQNQLTEQAWQRMQLSLCYEPTPLNANVVLFKARDLLPEYQAIDDEFNHWQKHITLPIVSYTVAGDHESILKQANVKKLGNIMNKYLGAIIHSSKT